MGRVIQIEGVGKERNQLIRSVVLALRELMRQTDTNATTRDLAAYIALALQAIHETIDESVEAWEKRGYWLKADRFRLEWAWAGSTGRAMEEAVLKDDWASIPPLMVRVAEKLNTVKLPQRNRLGTPWVGAWEKLQKSRK